MMTLTERDDVRRVLVWTWDAVVNGADVVRALEWQAAEGLWAYAVLHDARANTYVPATSDLARIDAAVRRLSQQHGGRGRVAQIAAEPAVFGMSRIHEVYAPEFRVFHTRADADEYLNAAEPS